MPNYVTNTITASPTVIDKISRHYTDEEKAERRKERAERAARYMARTGKEWEYGAQEAAEDETRFVDFNMVIPMPEAVQGTTVGSNGFGHDSLDGWYGWSVANWGTKWNAGDATIEALPGDLCRATFDTAWSHPEAVIYELSMACPGETLEVQWADEDLGSNVGTYKIKDGVLFEINQPEFGDESLELAAQIKYGMSYADYKAEWEDA